MKKTECSLQTIKEFQNETMLPPIEQEISKLPVSEQLELVERIIHRLKIQNKLSSTKRFRPSHFKGIYKHMSVDWQQEIRRMREEWTRSI